MLAIVLPDLVNRDNVRMVQPCGRLGFGAESLQGRIPFGRARDLVEDFASQDGYP